MKGQQPNKREPMGAKAGDTHFYISTYMQHAGVLQERVSMHCWHESLLARLNTANVMAQ